MIMGNGKEYKFDSTSLRSLFGHEDATQDDIDRLSRYYIKTRDYVTVSSDLPFCIVLGKKGTGKSATLKYSCFCDKYQTNFPVSIWVRASDITEMYGEINSNDNFELDQVVLLWKKAIAKYIACRLAEDIKFSANSDISKTMQWAYDTGYKSRDLISSIAKDFNLCLGPSVGTVSYAPQNESKTLGEHHLLTRILKTGVRLYIDDVDRGWKPNLAWATKIKALIVALGDMTSDISNFKARISLRTVVYDYICSDEEFVDIVNDKNIFTINA